MQAERNQSVKRDNQDSLLGGPRRPTRWSRLPRNGTRMLAHKVCLRHTCHWKNELQLNVEVVNYFRKKTNDN